MKKPTGFRAIEIRVLPHKSIKGRYYWSVRDSNRYVLFNTQKNFKGPGRALMSVNRFLLSMGAGGFPFQTEETIKVIVYLNKTHTKTQVYEYENSTNSLILIEEDEYLSGYAHAC